MSRHTRTSVGGQYDVVIGHGVLRDAARLVSSTSARAMVVHSESVHGYADAVVEAVRHRGLEVIRAVVPDAEAAKTAEVASQLWTQLGRAGFTRTDTVVAVGGGTVTDLAGFVAATWLRGVPVVQVPTTLLGMVDAAVGGKTAINTAEGKNLVGAFHPPAGVVCDLDTLATLPAADLVAGMAEVVKYGFIADPTILDLVEADPTACLTVGSTTLRELVERSVSTKATIVAADPNETWYREVLNYGHTLGHAIEQVEGYQVRHGEAVSIGMVYAAELGRLSGHLDEATAARHRSVLEDLGLPTTYRDDRWPELHAAMRRDKKSRGSMLRFVVLDGLADPVRLEGPDDVWLRAAFRAVASTDETWPAPA